LCWEQHRYRDCYCRHYDRTNEYFLLVYFHLFLSPVSIAKVVTNAKSVIILQVALEIQPTILLCGDFND
jgi:hypothetical protein